MASNRAQVSTRNILGTIGTSLRELIFDQATHVRSSPPSSKSRVWNSIGSAFVGAVILFGQELLGSHENSTRAKPPSGISFATLISRITEKTPTEFCSRAQDRVWR